MIKVDTSDALLKNSLTSIKWTLNMLDILFSCDIFSLIKDSIRSLITETFSSVNTVSTSTVKPVRLLCCLVCSNSKSCTISNITRDPESECDKGSRILETDPSFSNGYITLNRFLKYSSFIICFLCLVLTNLMKHSSQNFSFLDSTVAGFLADAGHLWHSIT
uniref:Putative uncharacterized protein YNL120C n=1 Tax=Saccharomyces cerevisiae (strain ATCC 204508 / S288c) TaxID=559292 RepID=YNM0_YEAST|nr:RecName: Full=Putative uncharacterized protein YNL120C [Saccharomyces cerevisiae S288C]CAA93387.1 N1909 [Saccharomyces cerevisiae]CAA96000.1 unnamed protein product [Saccharomyces cerevisiae]